MKSLNKENVFLLLNLFIVTLLLTISLNIKRKAQAATCKDSAICFSPENINDLPLDNYLAIKDKVLILSQLSTEQSDNNGSPSLRRVPTTGETKFEPQRIPLTLPSKKSYRSSPSITIINPSGYGASWGSAGIGIGLQERARFIDQVDGVFGFGFGLGNPQKNLGIQIGVTLVDLDNIFKDGTINLKLHRRIANDSSMAVGIQGLTTFGQTDGGSSGYGSFTHRFTLKPDKSKAFSEIYTTLGIGGGQFRSESDIDNGVESIGVFGSVAVRITEPVNAIAEWTGQDLTIGFSFVPFHNIPLVIIPAISDITGAAGDGARFIFGAGYGFSF